MTTPNQGAPDGAYVLGGRYGQDVTEASAMATMKRAPVNAWEYAQEAFQSLFRREYKTFADNRDGQTGLQDRLDLLGDVSGYATAFMGYNYRIPPSKWVYLPFDEQLGPVKNAGVVKPAAKTGWLVLKRGGLWRVDAVLNVRGFTQNSSVYPTIYPPYFVIVTTYNPIIPRYMIEIVSASGALLTSREFLAATDIMREAPNLAQITYPRSAAFSHTFVLEHMPAPESLGADAYWAYARVSMRFEPINAGSFNVAECWATGGTSLSGLTASRWSRDTINNRVLEVAPDGGNLG